MPRFYFLLDTFIDYKNRPNVTIVTEAGKETEQILINPYKNVIYSNARNLNKYLFVLTIVKLIKNFFLPLRSSGYKFP